MKVTISMLLDTKNKWWESGSAHSEMILPAISNDNEVEMATIAREHHMNTDIRKAIFVAIMGAQDYVDGMQRIKQLSLRGEQEREVVYVLMYCLGQSKTYNVYFQLLAEQLLRYSKATRFTFQLAYFDRMRELDKSNIRNVINWATLLGALIVKSSLVGAVKSSLTSIVICSGNFLP